MRLFVAAALALALLGLARPASAAVKCEPLKSGTVRYTTRYDHIDVDAILKSDRLLKSYVDCLMDRGPCTREGCFLHEIVPDALINECTKCSDVQKQQAGKILSYILQNHRNYWIELLGKYDPDGSFRKKYEFEDDDDDDDRRR